MRIPWWAPPVLTELVTRLHGDPFWEPLVEQLVSQESSPFATHLGVFVEPYLGFILEGKKPVDSRFSTSQRAPYKSISKGDIVLLKESGGPIVGICMVSHVWFYEIDPDSWRTIRSDFSGLLCITESSFWEAREHASFATLMRLKHVRSISPIRCNKKDRRGWVVIQAPNHQEGLF